MADVLHPAVTDPSLRFELLEVPGGPLAVLRAGEGPRVLLVPGYTGSKEDFRLLLGPLAAGGFQAVALDQRGQHQSPGPDDLGAYDVEVLAADLLAVVDVLGGEPVHLVGHSFGGIVSRAAVLQRPSAFRSLTLMCSGPAGLTGDRMVLVAMMKPLLEQGMPALVEAMDRMHAADAAHLALDASVQGLLRDRMVATSARSLLGMAVGLEHEPDRVAALRASGVRALVLHGADDDAWAPEVQADMAERLGAQRVVVDGAAHSPAVEQPAVTAAALLEFLRS